MYSWYTLEVEPGGTVRQKRSYNNDQYADLEDAKPFIAEWQQVVQGRMTDWCPDWYSDDGVQYQLGILLSGAAAPNPDAHLPKDLLLWRAREKVQF